MERVQGMTCDVCVYFIPNSRTGLFLDTSFFNVATSRASRHTLIISDPSLLNSSSCKGNVKQYLSALDSDFSFDHVHLV